MTGTLLILGRLFVILVGYIVAVLAAGAFFNIVMFGSAGYLAGTPAWAITASIAAGIPFIALIVGYYAFLPAAVIIGLTELLGRRDWLTYALGGGAASLLFIGYFRQPGYPEAGSASEPRFLDDPQMIMLIIGSGLVGGIAYWMVAGNSAGSWRNDFNEE